MEFFRKTDKGYFFRAYRAWPGWLIKINIVAGLLSFLVLSLIISIVWGGFDSRITIAEFWNSFPWSLSIALDIQTMAISLVILSPMILILLMLLFQWIAYDDWKREIAIRRIPAIGKIKHYRTEDISAISLVKLIHQAESTGQWHTQPDKPKRESHQLELVLPNDERAKLYDTPNIPDKARQLRSELNRLTGLEVRDEERNVP